ncbi:MAG: glycosyltransferase family 2 protein [Planctomycetes bacterium]|nr:glycosyltransferase family 2 protein [Planctomycetota bacterium]
MSTTARPTVSVITATRNRPEQLENALRSIARQFFRDFKSIVVDDGSNNAVFDTYECIWQGLDNRFHLADPQTPGAPGTGPADARNRGLAMASGEFVAFLDDDDEWIAPDHLQVGIDAMKRLDADWFFADMQGHRNGKVTKSNWFDCAPFLITRSTQVAGLDGIREVPLAIVLRTLQRQVIHPDIVIVRREIVQRFGGFLKYTWQMRVTTF